MNKLSAFKRSFSFLQSASPSKGQSNQFALMFSLLALALSAYVAYQAQLLPWKPEGSALAFKTESAAATLNLPVKSKGSTLPVSVQGHSFTTLIADVSEQVASSVVNIDVSKTKTISLGNMFPFRDELFDRFFGNTNPFDEALPQQQGRQKVFKQTGNGSGLVLDNEGHILTNHHVVGGVDEITVTFNNGTHSLAKVVGSDPFSDLAVIQVQDKKALSPATLGDSKALRPGDWAIAIGSPLGFDHTVTVGIISALSRHIPDINTNVEFIQTDAAINPGNSGGPLVNLAGEVIGINTAISGRAQNIGFAIPINTAREVAQALITQGKVLRPWIGIHMVATNPELLRSLGAPANTQGVIVADAVQGSPADKAGLQQGDILQHVEGKKLLDPETLQKMVREQKIGTALHCQIWRDGKIKALTITTEALDPKVLERQQQQ